jgi:hypothetical protein
MSADDTTTRARLIELLGVDQMSTRTIRAFLSPDVRVVGLALGLTGVGMVSPDGITRTLPTAITERMTAPERARAVFNVKANAWGATGRATLTVLQAYPPTRTSQAYLVGELGGAVRAMLAEHERVWVEVPPELLRIYACGTRKALREDVLVDARRGGSTATDPVQADAWWLRSIGRHLIEGRPMQLVSPEPYRDEVVAWILSERPDIAQLVQRIAAERHAAAATAREIEEIDGQLRML